MPYLRCETCGARALPIATRCPSCQDPFDFGTEASRLAIHRPRLERLRPCRSCDSLIDPESERCRWCDTPNPIRAGGVRPVVLAGGAVALVGGVALWLAVLAPDRPQQGLGIVFAPPASVSAAPIPDPVPTTPAPTPAEQEAPGPPEGSSTAESTTSWSRAVARTNVNVRSAPEPGSPIVGMVNANVEVQLGEREGTWRELRGGSVAGWVFEPLFTVIGG